MVARCVGPGPPRSRYQDGIKHARIFEGTMLVWGKTEKEPEKAGEEIRPWCTSKPNAGERKRRLSERGLRWHAVWVERDKAEALGASSSQNQQSEEFMSLGLPSHPPELPRSAYGWHGLRAKLCQGLVAGPWVPSLSLGGLRSDSQSQSIPALSRTVIFPFSCLAASWIPYTNGYTCSSTSMSL